MHRSASLAALVAAAFTLSACAVTDDLSEVPEPMGRFLLGHAVTVSDNPEVGPFSRTATDEAWQDTINFAMKERFGRYDGDKYFHISTKVEGYALAAAGVPLVAAPKSILIASVNIWDDEKGKTLLEDPEIFTVSEELSPDALIGTGLTKTGDEQMLSLSRSLAKSVHDFMLENVEWFGDASLMDPATTSPGRPAPTAGTIPPQFKTNAPAGAVAVAPTEETEPKDGLIIESSEDVVGPAT